MRTKRISSMWPPLVVLVLVLLPLSAWGQYTPTGVYYDYSQLAVGDQTQFVLIPRTTDAFSPTVPLQVSVPDAFRVLRDNKRATYGNASLTLTDDDIERGRVVVHIDPEQRDWYLIVAAETVYTFTELGAQEVVFSGISDDPWTRADIPFSALVWHVPMWRAIPPAHIASGYVVLPDGGLLDSVDFYERWTEGDDDLEDDLLSYLTSGSTVEQSGVLTLLPDLEIRGALDAVAPLLESEQASIRILAIEYLAPLGDTDSLDQIAALLDNDPSADVRAAAATALGESGQAHYAFFDLVHRLDSVGDDELAGVIAELAETGDPRAVEPILSYLSYDDTAVRDAAVIGLQTLNATDEMLSLIDDAGTVREVRLFLANILADQGDAEARLQALELLVNIQEGPVALEAFSQLVQAEIDSESLVDAIMDQLEHPDTLVRHAAAQWLGENATEDELSQIADALDDEADDEVAETLETAATNIISRLSVTEVQELAEGRDLFLKRAAFRALGQLAQEGRANQSAFRTLLDGLEDAEPSVRGAAALGIAAFGDTQAFDALMPLTEDSSELVRRDIARGLANFEIGQGDELLMQYLDDDDPSVVAAAISTMGTRGQTEMLSTFLELTQSRSAVIRAAAVDASSYLYSAENEQSVINMLIGATSDTEPRVRSAAARALGRIDNQLAVLGISPLTQDSDEMVRFEAISALASSGNDAALGVLTSLLEERDPDIRTAALIGLANFGSSEAIADIERLLTVEEEPSVINAAETAIEQLQGQ